MADKIFNFFKQDGVTTNTPKSINLGAGTIYKNLKFVGNEWSGSILGATSGGNKITITNTITNLGENIDGINVKTKGLEVLQGMLATLETNVVEITDEIMKMAILGVEDDETTVDKYTVIKPKDEIKDDDYIENVAFVGFTADKKAVIIIMENALCTNGLNTDSKKNDMTVLPLTFECHSTIDANNHDVLPVTIFYPKN